MCVYLCVCACVSQQAWGGQRTTSGMDLHVLLCLRQGLLFILVYTRLSGHPASSDSPGSAFHFPTGVLGLQTLATASRFVDSGNPNWDGHASMATTVSTKSTPELPLRKFKTVSQISHIQYSEYCNKNRFIPYGYLFSPIEINLSDSFLGIFSSLHPTDHFLCLE